MALTPEFSVGPPPKVGELTRSGGKDIFVPNASFYNWMRLFWQWSTTLGNNADGAASFSGSIAIGTSPNWFKVDASGAWMGGATFATSPWKVSMAGAMTATSGTFSGSITGASGTFSGDIVTTGHVKASGEYDGGFTTLASVTGSSTSTGNYAGVLGYATGSGAFGVKGVSTNAGGGEGVYGISAYGIGVYGEATHTGAYALAALASGGAIGLYVNGTTTLLGNVTATGLTITAGTFAGNASTATSAATLTTPRTIGTVSFDGSANIVPITTANNGGAAHAYSFTGGTNAPSTSVATFGNLPAGSAASTVVWVEFIIDTTSLWIPTWAK